jgi:hypothetical protein
VIARRQELDALDSHAVLEKLNCAHERATALMREIAAPGNEAVQLRMKSSKYLFLLGIGTLRVLEPRHSTTSQAEA